MTHTKARRHEVKNGKEEFFEILRAFVSSCEILSTHKRGLMQQLFPSPEEVEA